MDGEAGNGRDGWSVRRNHGRVERGIERVGTRGTQGRFGRLFGELPPAEFSPEALKAVAAAMNPAPTDAFPSEWDEVPEENFGLAAGYTYFGQWLAHEITFDPLSSLSRANDPGALQNFRTPALDLDSLYGRGPQDQPYLYESAAKHGDPRRFALGEPLSGIEVRSGFEAKISFDLPRFNGHALIGDKRNDENVIIAQLHVLGLRFHNWLCDQYPDASFAEVQQLVCWHFQWLVLFDFLPRLIGPEALLELLPHLSSGKGIHRDPPRLWFYRPRGSAYIPVEFSGAAYRFGHSMVRPVYRLSLKDLQSRALPGLAGRKAVFAPTERDGLNGFQPADPDWGIDWSLFFDGPRRPLTPGAHGPTRVQPAYKIDTSLVAPLAALPEFSRPGTREARDAAAQPNQLALRNLLRGRVLGLPSGQDVARAMGLEVLRDEELRVGSATAAGWAQSQPLVAFDKSFRGHAPLWFYVLAEAQAHWARRTKRSSQDRERDEAPTWLGPVGARLVGEVLIGLILADGQSFLRRDPSWVPLLGSRGPRQRPLGRFGFGHLVEKMPLP